jgi:hypothetical protein
VKDVDVFCEPPDVDTSKTSRQVLAEVVRVLRGEYGDRVDKQDWSVKVDFQASACASTLLPTRPPGE